jgi:hypothetical protein
MAMAEREITQDEDEAEALRDAPEFGIEITTDTPERFRYLIGRKNEKELFGMPTGSVTIERVRKCVVKGTVEIQMTYRAG